MAHLIQQWLSVNWKSKNHCSCSFHENDSVIWLWCILEYNRGRLLYQWMDFLAKWEQSGKQEKIHSFMSLYGLLAEGMVQNKGGGVVSQLKWFEIKVYLPTSSLRLKVCLATPKIQTRSSSFYFILNKIFLSGMSSILGFYFILM